MKILRAWCLALLPFSALAANGPDYVESFDTIYNSLTVEKRGSLVELRAMVRARGVRSLHEDGWRCVASGETTIDEVVRMVSEDDGA